MAKVGHHINVACIKSKATVTLSNSNFVPSEVSKKTKCPGLECHPHFCNTSEFIPNFCRPLKSQQIAEKALKYTMMYLSSVSRYFQCKFY